MNCLIKHFSYDLKTGATTETGESVGECPSGNATIRILSKMVMDMFKEDHSKGNNSSLFKPNQHNNQIQIHMKGGTNNVTRRENRSP